MEVGRERWIQTGAEVEARITERGKNFGENIGEWSWCSNGGIPIQFEDK
jgi:hypothetical protein